MDRVELIIIVGGAIVIAIAVAVVVMFPRLGGDHTKAVGGDPSGSME